MRESEIAISRPNRWPERFLKGAMASLALITVSQASIAHHAPSGWAYPPGCCASYRSGAPGGDCFPIDGADIERVPGGWLVKSTQEVIPFEQSQPSGDSHWHRCAYDPRKPNSRTRDDMKNLGLKCLYYPNPEQ